MVFAKHLVCEQAEKIVTLGNKCVTTDNTEKRAHRWVRGKELPAEEVTTSATLS